MMNFFRQREEIIERMLPVAKHVARRFRGGRGGEEYDDLFQAASVGLVNAVNRFDPDKGTEFLPFAVPPTIMGEVRRHFRDRGWALKVPRRLKELQGQLIQARAELSQRSGRAPTPSELAEHLGIDRETVVDALIAGSNYSTLSTDAPAGGGTGGTVRRCRARWDVWTPGWRRWSTWRRCARSSRRCLSASKPC